jgi:hypothetical protein
MLKHLHACSATFPAIVINESKHLYHTRKFSSGIAQMDIALALRGA